MQALLGYNGSDLSAWTLRSQAQEVSTPMPPQPTPEERFWSKVEFTDSCWLWTAGVSSSGYGAFTIHYPKKVSAHRFSYYLTYSVCPPNGYQIDHLCRNKRCVRPDHLEAVTQADNIHRARTSSLYCPREHFMSVENTEWDRGKRVCAECHRARSRHWYAQSGRLQRGLRAQSPWPVCGRSYP